LDADSEIDSDYLAVIDRELDKGHKVLQGFVRVIKPERSPAASLIFLGWSMNQQLRHTGTSWLGYFTFLLGNGFCIKAEVINTYGWNAVSILEDVEYGLMLRLLGFKVIFVPDARVYAQNPGTFRYAESQRIRWDQGRFLMMKNFLPKLLSCAMRRKDISLLFSAIELLIPPYTLLISFIIFLFLIFLYISYLGIEVNLSLWILTLLALMGYSVLGLIVSGASLKVWKSVLYVPFFMSWRILINIKGYFQQGSTKWIKTERENL